MKIPGFGAFSNQRNLALDIFFQICYTMIMLQFSYNYSIIYKSYDEGVRK